MLLSDLQNNEKGIITKVKGRGAFRKRIIEMGFIKGKEVTVIKDAPLKDPIEYNIMGYNISLRRSEAQLIEILTPDETLNFIQNDEFTELTFSGDIYKTTACEKGRNITVALVGNPNCGKTTLFNNASGSREHVGNYSGVTVDAKHAYFKQSGYHFTVVDLPGTYSLSAYSPEELYVRRFIYDEMPDIVINVIDSSNLERNLYLTTQLIDMDIKVVGALNMFDELTARKIKFDYDSLGSMIGIPMVPCISSQGKGIKELFDKVIEVYEDASTQVRHIHIHYGQEIEKAIKTVQQKIKVDENRWLTDKFSTRFLSIKLLEKDNDALQTILKCQNSTEITQSVQKQIAHIETELLDDSETLITDAKYGFISGALRETYEEPPSKNTYTKTDIIDTFITHKVFGFPIFIFFMWVMFQSTFTLGSYPKDWIEHLVKFIGLTVENYMPPGILKDLFIDGIIGGVGGVIVFLPNILILFFFISLMEDTGYMARVAFIMDKLMHKMGLHGKSFIPLVMGFGCNVPAIMATRTLENRNDRLLTMLINPFMSCSARLPVYILVIGAVFPNHSGTFLFAIYLIGISLAIGMAIVFKKTLFRSTEAPFVMELPPYRTPTLKSTMRHMWDKGAQYLKKMGGIILVASIIIWALGYFPQNIKYTIDYQKKINQVELKYHQLAILDSLNKLKFESQKEEEVKEILIARQSERQEKSYIGKLGKAIQPVLAPLGFDWKMTVAIMTGIAGKEIVVSTMSVLYQTNSNAEDVENLKTRIQNEKYTDGINKGKNVFSPLAAFCFLLFVLIYFPCIAVIAAINNESGSWKWATFSIFYTTGLAWLISFLVHFIGSFFI